MEKRKMILEFFEKITLELLHGIVEMESNCEDEWIPLTDINKEFGLDLPAVPLASERRPGHKGWLLATLTRRLEDKGIIEYKKEGGRAFYRSKRK